MKSIMTNAKLESLKMPFNNEKLVVSIASLGMFLSTLDSGIINVALPTLQQQFQVATTTISWTVSLYLLTLSSSIIVFGKLSDRYGRLKIFKMGLILFAMSSILCGLANNAQLLILFRGMQGFGAAMLQATSVALITTLIVSEHRGLALGTLGMIMAMGPILGPTVGGLLISTIGWRWIFWINLPVCIFGIWGCYKLQDIRRFSQVPINLFASFLLTVCMLCILLIITLWPEKFKFVQFIIPMTIGLLAGVWVLVWQQKNTLHPIIPLHVFGNIRFVLALFTTFSFGIATAIVLVVPPFFLEKIVHFLPWQVGLVSFCAPLGIVSTARLSGKYINWLGTYRLMLIGLFIMMLGLFGLLFIGKGLDPLFFPVLLLIYGIGGGLFQPSNISAITSAIEHSQQGAIGAVNRMIHNFGNALGVAMSAVFLQTSQNELISHFKTGFFQSWIFALALILISFVGFAILELKNTLFSKFEITRILQKTHKGE